MGGAKPKQACDWLADRVAPDPRQVEYYTRAIYAIYARRCFLMMKKEAQHRSSVEGTQTHNLVV